MNGVRKLLAFFLLAATVSVVSAQDVITQKNGEEIQAKVLEVGAKDVKYKRFGNDTGPTYTLKASDIFMIKYENGEKDMFGNTPEESETPAVRPNSPTQRTSVASQSSNQNRANNANRVQPARESENTTPKEEPIRKAYIGLGVGGAFTTKSYDNIDGGIQVNINFGYMLSKNIGIAASMFGTSFDLTNYSDASIGLSGIMAGPLFSSTFQTEKWEFDVRPMIGFAIGTVKIGSKSETTDDNTVAFGVGTSARWNFASRFSASGNIDYYNGKIDDVDLSSMGITVGINFRF